MNEYVNAIYNQRNPNALKELLEKKKKDLDEALLTVITDMDMATDEKEKHCKSLLHAGASPDVRTLTDEPILHQSIEQGLLGVIHLLLEFNPQQDARGEAGRTGLHIAAINSVPKLVEKLLAEGMDPNAQDDYGFTPLFYALLGSQKENVSLLLQHSDLTLTSKDGQNALHILVEYNEEDVSEYMEMLVKHNFDLEARDNYNNTALGLAAGSGQWMCLCVLITAGCDVNSKNYDDESPLIMLAGFNVHEAGKVRRREARMDLFSDDQVHPSFTSRWDDQETRTAKERLMACKLLLAAGADVDQASASLATPLSGAIANWDYDLVQLFVLEANCNCIGTGLVSDDDIQMLVDRVQFDLVRYILKDSYPDDMEFKRLEEISEGNECWDLDTGEEFNLSGPISLARSCRFAIRSALPKGLAFLPALESLPLPLNLINFLALRRS